MSERRERAAAKGELATELALTGAAVGSVFGPTGAAIGGATGGLAGLIVGDENFVFPLDMVAIPAFQAYMITGSPAATIYIKAGETLMATGGNVDAVEEGMMEAELLASTARMESGKRKRRKGAGLPRKYAKMGFKKGWREYKKTPAYKRKQAAKKKKTRRKR